MNDLSIKWEIFEMIGDGFMNKPAKAGSSRGW